MQFGEVYEAGFDLHTPLAHRDASSDLLYLIAGHITPYYMCCVYYFTLS